MDQPNNVEYSLYLFMDELSGERLADYKHQFEQLKRNERGVITIKELGYMVRSMGENPSEKELEKIFRASDLDGNGEIDFKEYCFVMAQFENDEDREMCDIFKMFDRDGDGYISEHDFWSY
ncbi:calmodulin-like [Drosophila serrata]|uniref:calmodulin-like n=1 Tax=Drosophila serrata TaxID=7274 RepID=UPI000A1D29C2|nr:calmodulin-like [Drosophila serrata]